MKETRRNDQRVDNATALRRNDGSRPKTNTAQSQKHRRNVTTSPEKIIPSLSDEFKRKMRSMGINGIILTQDAFTVEGYGRGATISLNTTIEKLTVKVNNLRKVHGYDSQGKILNAYIAYVPELGSDADLNQSEQHTSIAKSKGDTKAPRLHLRKHTLPLVKTPNSLYTLPVLSNKPEIAKFGERKRRIS